jgi:hypothetical protein
MVVHAFRRHVWIQFEGLQRDFGIDCATRAAQRFFQAEQTDGAPGAGDVRDEVDVERNRH